MGRTIAALFSETYSRIIAPGLSWLDESLPAPLSKRHPLPVAWRSFNQALDAFMEGQMMAA